jgi:hypothetical protein
MIEFHEAANLFPMELETIDELAADIKRNGQFEAVKIYQGKILDGRRRWTACQRAGIEAKTETINPHDPVAYVLSTNLHRRHLTTSQKAMVAARAAEIYAKVARERMESGKKNSDPEVNFPQGRAPQSRDQAGKALGVSGKSVDFAKRVLEHGTPELIRAVEEGRVAVSTAAVAAKEPEEVQRELAENATINYAGREKTTKEKKKKQKEEEEYFSPEERLCIANGQVFDGVRFATMAIEQLKRIKKDDPNRVKALVRVREWIDDNLNS